jgi:hypothetical protein
MAFSPIDILVYESVLAIENQPGRVFAPRAGLQLLEVWCRHLAAADEAGAFALFLLPGAG